MQLSDFDYTLPKERIAQTPLAERDQSRLMVVDRTRQRVQHHRFCELPDLLPAGAVLVLNDSKVIPARLRFQLGNGQAEILLIKEIEPKKWECMVRPGPKFKEGDTIRIDRELSCAVRRVEPLYGLRTVEFYCNDLQAYLEAHGQMPTPPYIREVLSEPERYQTTYARAKGSVAAPTAGLHFTERIFQALKARGVGTEFVTLHVGLGTFQPVKVKEVSGHRMHSEWFTLNEETAGRLNAAKKAGRPIVAVGTTAVRVLEHCADPEGVLSAQTGETDIFITPGYRFKMVDHLVTNFHLPKSTLLMLVSAFCDVGQGVDNVSDLRGRDLILKAYREAIDCQYRFFSFGDAMLVV